MGLRPGMREGRGCERWPELLGRALGDKGGGSVSAREGNALAHDGCGSLLITDGPVTRLFASGATQKIRKCTDLYTAENGCVH